MIVWVGSTGMTAWQRHEVFGSVREMVCLTDGFRIDIPLRAAKNPRGVLVAMREHSETHTGRTVSVSELSNF
jgi:hypothetical protein